MTSWHLADLESSLVPGQQHGHTVHRLRAQGPTGTSAPPSAQTGALLSLPQSLQGEESRHSLDTHTQSPAWLIPAPRAHGYSSESAPLASHVGRFYR